MKGEGASDAVLAAIRKAPYHEAKGGGHSNYQKTAAQTHGDPDKAFAEADVVSEGLYGAPVIVHCCLEPHGSVSEWTDKDHLFTHISTQNVSGIAAQMAEPLGISAANIRVHQDNIGGGFGSKFAADRWDITAARLSKKAGGRPVRIMLERDSELKVAGARPSAYARVKVAAKKDGTLTGMAVAILGNGRSGRRRHAADSVRFQHSQPAQGTHRHSQQHRPGTRLARSQPSAGRRHHHGRAGRSGRQAQHGSSRSLAEEPRDYAGRDATSIAKSSPSPPT